ncbi:filamentous hemagglutinin N-terminal domain-containing protein, partial [uncultured Tateyamaria sp.]|uniref:filamentous hemagglutinin N-terminal domain-containing protein n=1 Tax=uncultured Tateyamaria sp. TaxID=455651 RepID=UPI0026299F34
MMYVQVRRKFGRFVSCVLSVVLAVQPVLAQAQSITLVSPSGGPRPHVDASQNGTAVLNISRPNAAGVSHDRYSDFQAGDLIVNNSATITGTTLGGFVEGNANLTPGREADLWIGEVVGGNATQLTGILEVAGPSMDMVLANEFGITCNGCGFINTGRATLTTGSPQFGANGSLSGFDVRQGTVTIGAGGLNPENRVALSDASRVDVIARAAQVYGAMRGDRLNIVAGANQVDYDWSYTPDTGETSGITEQAGAGQAPALAVDVAALGGMYANAIRLVATENGVGVRLNGEMASSSDIAIRADGRLTLGAPSGTYTPQIRSRNRVSIRNQGPLVLEGSITSETGDLIDITTTHDSLTFTGEARGGAITLESSGLARIEGALIAQDALSIRSSLGAVEVAAGATLFAGSASLGAANTVQFAGQADVERAVDMVAGPSVTLTGSSAVQGKTFSATA